MSLEELKSIRFHFLSHISKEDDHITIYESADGKMKFYDHTPLYNGKPKEHTYREYSINGVIYKTKAAFENAALNYKESKK